MTEEIPTYCMTCYVGPDPIKVIVEDGEAVDIEPNPDAAPVSPSKGRPCVKAYSLIEKLYDPNRVKTPLLRGNPKKGRNEDPKWREISWDEALRILAERLREIREEKGFVDENGYPTLACTLGGAGIPEGHYGTFPAFLSGWEGLVDITIGSGQAVKCYHSEHVFQEFWHRAFMAVSDLPRTKYVLSLGHNTNASDGVGVWKTAEARERGLRKTQVEPHLSISAATSDKWVPIKPKTDAIFLCSMINFILHEKNWENLCDIEFLKKMTNSPYLIGPNGYYLRDEETERPQIWDPVDDKPKAFDDPSIKDYALTGEYQLSGIELGPDEDRWKHDRVKCKPSFQLLIEAVEKFTPEYAGEICDIPRGTVREVTEEFVESAMVGETTEVEGEELPYRPVSIIMGKTVNNAPGGLEACWARTVLLTLVGALEVPGGTIGACTKLYPPYHERWSSVRPGSDGFMNQALNYTDKENWPKITSRGQHTALTPFNSYRGWATGIAPFTLAWLFMDEPPENWPKPSPPDVWMIYRANPVKTQFDPELVERVTKGFPFIVHFTAYLDETSWYSDLILPDHTDLEGLQLKLTMNRHWQHIIDKHGFVLKQPVVEPLYNTMDISDIWTELADRLGFLDEYNNAINRGSWTGFPLSGKDYDYSLEEDKKYGSAEIWDKVCRAVTRGLSDGKEEHGLDWFKENGFYAKDMSELERYLHPKMEKEGLRYELPYQETIYRIGKELERRLHERDIHWWDSQLKDYRALPIAENFLDVWNRFYEKFGEDPANYDFWLISSRSMQYAWTSNVNCLAMKMAADSMLDFGGVVINTSKAKEMGIEDGDRIVVESPFDKTEANVITREGIRPDVVVVLGQFGRWKGLFAKDLNIPNVTDHTKIDLDVLDAGGSGADLVKVKIYKAEA
ncbi:hypothetical protein AKJ44_01735 [candidate division MSBL1 archaeon SCGC-AAA261F17]|uniref:4Fe-4S Mo/W bis-MGD-type domain-containing protein n=1 Tax=candidate division MSBL1 archaeon SCGC-AAA261F17 TaxID=1698274 RepID=A0A133V6A9_9EURY|nr:hypothetical protein AKJ44_01735 [candidate division MSBL1 archaeon SCGC-AAA261F17]